LLRHKPDVILTAAAQVPAMLQELGYRIPQDIGVAGASGDVPVDAGINQHSEEIGRIAVEMLVKQININELGVPSAPCRILVESHWVDGKSLPHALRSGF
jgi:DNA-binding LacI/PurR family transcriptional regulator